MLEMNAMTTAVAVLPAVALTLVGSGATALERDAEGWTIFEPSADTRILYVSSSEGDDGTAVAYEPADGAVGWDPFMPG
ncbi:MAG: hypothetical protein PVH68_17370, partial [Armatimonadota bacterium]